MLPIHAQSSVRIAMPLTQLSVQAGRLEQSQPNAFINLLSQGITSVNDTQHHADSQVHELLTGGDVTQAEVLTSVQKADMAFRMLIQVRNKLMSAYEELNSIRV